jgi:hypothetical protein
LVLKLLLDLIKSAFHRLVHIISKYTTSKIQTYNTGAWQDRLTILNDGKVGIGMRPTVALDVSGTLKATAINFQAGACAAGYVLVPDFFERFQPT